MSYTICLDRIYACSWQSNIDEKLFFQVQQCCQLAKFGLCHRNVLLHLNVALFSLPIPEWFCLVYHQLFLHFKGLVEATLIPPPWPLELLYCQLPLLLFPHEPFTLSTRTFTATSFIFTIKFNALGTRYV